MGMSDHPSARKLGAQSAAADEAAAVGDAGGEPAPAHAVEAAAVDGAGEVLGALLAASAAPLAACKMAAANTRARLWPKCPRLNRIAAGRMETAVFDRQIKKNLF